MGKKLKNNSDRFRREGVCSLFDPQVLSNFYLVNVQLNCPMFMENGFCSRVSKQCTHFAQRAIHFTKYPLS